MIQEHPWRGYLINRFRLDADDSAKRLQRAQQRAVREDHVHRALEPGPAETQRLVGAAAADVELRSIQSDIDLSTKLQTIVTQNQLAGAGGLIGRYVSGIAEDNTRVIGRVDSVSSTVAGPVLNLDTGGRVLFSNVDEMRENAPSVPGSPG